MSQDEYPTCRYETPDGSFKCSRVSQDDRGYCTGHLHVDGFDGTGLDQAALEEMIEKKDGTWTGLQFISEVKLDDLKIDFPIDARRTKFHGLELSKILLKEEINFSDASFKNKIIFRDKVIFCESAIFLNVNFNCVVTFENGTSFEGVADFRKAVFTGYVQFSHVNFCHPPKFDACAFEDDFLAKSSFLNGCSFSGTVFHEAVKFLGNRSHVLVVDSATIHVHTGQGELNQKEESNKTLLQGGGAKLRESIISLKNLFIGIKKKTQNYFKALISRTKKISTRVANFINDPSVEFISSMSGKIYFEDVKFLKPEKVWIERADFRKALVKGTYFNGVSLVGVNWEQEKLGRNGIYDDVFLMESFSGKSREFVYPVIESQYRHLRTVLENNKDFLAASDFYIGEMDYRLRQKGILGRFFSISAFYNYLSRYATRPLRAIFAYFVLLGIYITLSILITGDFVCLWERAYSGLSLMTLKASSNTLEFDGPHKWLDLAFRIIGPFQIALIALSIRNQVKRN
ncbi:pentapeptide repeat-containing protein [Emcibacter nanhaiensis]|uniref:Pentapeptide repeat-containing protein n=1 Tax=Emcibacter nanhaiensis TaxID=1505037 RepID=A0A501PCT2_9PROT|nr:pentapeptide repeat-containing protein [Emcibacter nanhaiensis]TPD57832.1 hypothetical protein FIV46_17165 [Emcibacter nanhaiensis]